MPEWGDFLLTERGTDRDREVAGGIQYEAAAFVARLQAASTSGPQPSGCTKRKFSGPSCDVNSLIRAGTKTRASQDELQTLMWEEFFCRGDDGAYFIDYLFVMSVHSSASDI